MLKPERVTFSADDDKFHQFPDREQLDTFLNDSLVHYSTDFKNPIQHSTSLDELSSINMSSQQQQQQQQAEHEPPISAPPAIISEQVPVLNETNLRQYDALTLQQLATSINPISSIITTDENSQTSPSRTTTSFADVQKELDRVKQMKYGRTYSSPTSSLCSKISINPFNGSNTNIDLSAITHSVHFTEQTNSTNHLPFSSTYITSIPESIVPASGSSSTNDNHFIPIHNIESPTLEDREVFETFHVKQPSVPGVAIRQSANSFNSETDLIASLHRSVSKQALDTQSEHGTTCSGTSDEMIFAEWDKERSLFQEYINSLRTEIRVLLQERAEYQKQMDTIDKNLNEHKRLNLTQVHGDQTKYDLLQKSLEEKNTILEQLQKEYETMKEKNVNLSRKISNLRCDAKAQTGVIDELKQKIADLTVDIQNHVLVKRRLEVSMMNLESDCKVIDAERIRLTHDVKDVHSNRQDLEKLLQQANVQIAEQGSTIELLRSDNIQIRSQLSATQRRMLQEKQQVMDYLHQIENDLVEKEQLKQRETLLRKDYEKLQQIHQKDRQEIEQFNLQINHDKQKLSQLEQERVQLLKTIQNFNDKQTQVESELDAYKSATKRLYSHFKIPFDSIQSIDQLIPMLEDRYRTEQVSHARIHSIPLVQSPNEVEQLQENLQSMTLQLKQLEDANQAWQDYQQNQLIVLRDRLKLTDVDNASFDEIVQQIENRLNDLETVKQTKDSQTENDEQDDVANLTAKCAQLDEANRAWQTYHQTQVDSFRDKLQANLPIENNLSLDDIAQQILQHLQQTEEQNETSSNQINELNEQIDLLKQQTLLANTSVERTTFSPDVTKQIHNISPSINEHEQELQQLRQTVALLNEQCAQLDQANQAWQQYQQTQTEKFTNELQQHLPIDENITLDQFPQLIINQINKEREDFDEKYQAVVRENADVESLRESLTSKVNELNDELVMMKEAYDRLDQENQAMKNEVDSDRRSAEKVSSYFASEPLKEVPIHQTGVDSREVEQLRENVASLTAQCAQLDEANRAWQSFQQTQADNFRSKLQEYVSINEDTSFDQIPELIIEQLQSYTNTVNESNRELSALKEAYDQLEQRSNQPVQQPLGSGWDDDWSQGLKQNVEEIEQLRENVASLTAQCAQLDEANRAWQSFQQTQADNFRSKLQEYVPIDEDTSFDQIPELIINQLTKEREASNDARSEKDEAMKSIHESYANTVTELNQELLALKEAYQQLSIQLDEKTAELLQERSRQSTERVSSESPRQLFTDVPIHQTGVDSQDVQQLQENVASLTAQCAQLDQANRAWQSYQQAQADNFRSKLQEYLPIDEDTSFDQIPELIIEQLQKQPVPTEETLENIRQSYTNTVNELNQELSALKEAYDQLEQRSNQPAQQSSGNGWDDDWSQGLKEVPLQTSSSSAGNEQNGDETEQLREDVARLTSQCAQLDEANRAWQSYQQTQKDAFRNTLQDCLAIDDNLSLDQIAQQIMEYINTERAVSDEKYAALQSANSNLQSELTNDLESIKESYTNTVNELNQELDGVKEAYEQLNSEKQSLIAELDKRSIENNNPDEVAQLREELAVLTSQYAQLTAANQAWEQFHQTQLGTFRQQMQDHIPIDENLALDQIGQHIIDQLTRERSEFSENLQSKEDLQHRHIELLKPLLPSSDKSTLEDIIDELVSYINQLKRQNISLEQDLAAVQAQYSQLETANEAWQSFYNNQLEVLKQNLQDFLPLNDEQNFESILHSIVDYLQQSKAQLEILDNENQQLKHERSLSPLISQKQDVPIHQLTPVQSSSSPALIGEDELEQLRTNLLQLTEQCTQLDEANRAWQIYHENQVKIFRDNLQDSIFLDENQNLEQMAHEIRQEFNKLKETDDNYQLNETMLAQNLEQLNQKLTDVHRECEEFREANVKLISIQQQIEQQNDLLTLENQQLKSKVQEIPIQRVESPRENVAIHNVDQNRDEEIRQLRDDLATASAQYLQLEEANRAWQQYQHDQVESFRQNLAEYIPTLEQIEALSLDYLAQQINNYTQQLHGEKDNLTRQIESLQHELQAQKYNTERPGSADSSKRMYRRLSQERHLRDAQIHNISPVQSASPSFHEHEQELQQLRQTVALLTDQCAQLEQANQAWQQYQQTQTEKFTNELQQHLPIDANITLDQFPQLIINQINKEREDFTRQYDALQENQQSPVDLLRSQLDNCFSFDSNGSFDEILQQIVDQVTREREDFDEKYQAVVRENADVGSLRESLANKVNALNDELVMMKEAYDRLDQENQVMKNEVDSGRRSAEKVSSYFASEPLKEVPIHQTGVDSREVEQLRENVASLTAQCAHLDEANRAWQSFQQTQADNFRSKLQEYLPLNEDTSFDQIPESIIQHLQKQPAPADETLEDIRQSYTNTVNELNQELSALKEAYDQLDNEKQALTEELEQRSNQPVQQPSGNGWDDDWNQGLKQNVEEIEQLREDVARLTSQCAQLDEANRAWQSFQQTQADNFRSKLQEYLPIDEDTSFDQIPELIIEQLQTQPAPTDETLEDIRQSYTNTVNELNQELSALKEAYDQLDNEKQVLTEELEQRSNQPVQQSSENGWDDDWNQGLKEVPLQASSSAGNEKNVEEIEQLRENVASLTAQCAQLDEANRAWQSYQQTQADNFRFKLQEYVSIDEETPFDQIPELIIEELAKVRLSSEDSATVSESMENLESVRQSYINTVAELNQELSTMKEAYEQLDTQNQELLYQLDQKAVELSQAISKQNTERVSSESPRQLFADVPIHQTGIDSQEVEQLRENVSSLTAQCAHLDEANRAWQSFQQTQADNFRSKLQEYLPIDEDTSFDQIPELIIEQLQKQSVPTDETLENIRQSYTNTVNELNQELSALKEAYDQLEQRSNQPVQQSSGNEQNIEEIEQLRENVARLTNQCGELDEANRAWQMYVQSQTEVFRNKLRDYLLIDENMPFDQIPDVIIERLSREATDNDLLTGTQAGSSEELIALKEAYDRLNREKQALSDELEQRYVGQDLRSTEKVSSNMWNQPFEDVPIHTSSGSSDTEKNLEELQQLRETVVNLTAQCTELNDLKTKLCDCLNMNNDVSIDDISEKIVDRLMQERQSNEIVDELNQELVLLKNKYEELEKQNQQLLLEKEDRSLVVGHHSTTEPNPFDSDEQVSAVTNAESDEIHQIRSDLANLSSQYTTLNETKQNELNSLRQRLQNWISLSPDSTLDEIAHQLHLHFEQQIPPQTTEIHTQTNQPVEQIDIAIGTIPLVQQHQHTQIDPIDKIDQQIQTESLLQLWSLSNDDHLFASNDDEDRLRDYIDELQYLSSADMVNRLTKECDQILTKQNLSKDIYSQLDNNQLALITIYSLYQQHLTDDAKLLYNETVIRALKQEYELINNEKTDYMERYLTEVHATQKKYDQLQNQYDELLEQNELERLHAKQSMKDSIDNYELQLYNLHQDNEQLKFNINILQNNYQKVQDLNYDELNREYQQLRTDYDELINKNELLLNYNSEMYQRKLQVNGDDETELVRDADIQCNLIDDVQLEKQPISVVTESNDWDNDLPIVDTPTDEQVSSLESKQTVDNETQTDEQSQEKLTQVNQKLKRALQNMKERIHQAIVDKPDLYPDVSDDTMERLDRIILTVEDQAYRINLLQNEFDQSQDEIIQLRNSIPTDESPSINPEQSLVAEIEQVQLSTTEPISAQSDDEVQALKDEIEEKSAELKDLGEKYLALTSQFDQEKQEMENRLNDYQNQIDNLSQERAQLLEELRNNASSSAQPSDSDKATKVNAKLKRLLQTVKDKINRLAAERPELFTNIGEETSERFDHLIATVEHQATQIEMLQSEHNETQEQLRNEIQELQSSVEAYRYQIENERPVRSEPLVTASAPSVVDEYEQQVRELQQELSQSEGERQLLREHLNEIELELNKANDEKSTVSAMYEEQLKSIIQERNALVEHHTTEIEMLQSEHNESEEQLRNEIQELQSSVEADRYQIENERPIRSEPLVTASAPPVVDESNVDEYEQQIKELQKKLSQYEDERQLLRERLNEIELEFSKANDDRSSVSAMYEEQLQSLSRERDTLIEHQAAQSAESERQIEELQQALDEMKQPALNEEIQTLRAEIEEKSDELRDLSDKYFALSSQFNQERNDMESRLSDYQNQVENLSKERAQLLEEMRHHGSSSVQSGDGEKATGGDQQLDKLVKVNTKLKRVLQTFKEKISRLVTERPELFANIGEETSERFDHLIATVEHQATQIEMLQSEHNETQEQLRNESLVATSAPSVVDEYEQQIKELQKKLSQYEDERQLLRERLNEVELEFGKANDERSSVSTMYEEQLQSVIQERNALVEQQAMQIDMLQREHNESQEQLQNEIQELKQELDQLRDVSAKYDDVLSQLNTQQEQYANLLQEVQQKASSVSEPSEAEKQTTDQQHDKLTKVNTKLKRVLQTFKEKINRLASERPELFTNIGEETSERFDHIIATIEQQAPQSAESLREVEELKDEIAEKSAELKDLSERYFALTSQHDQEKQEMENRLNDYQNQIDNLSQERAQPSDSDKATKVNAKLKRLLQTVKDKINRLATERPELFTNIGEETNERFDHIIATVELQATQMEMLQSEHNETQEQLRNEIQELQSSVEAYRYQIENERPVRSEPLVTASAPSVVDEYEQQIKELQKKLSQYEDERQLLRERLNEVELEFGKANDERSSVSAMYEEQLQSVIQERNALVEQQATQTAESLREVEELKNEIEEKSTELKDLSEKYLALTSQLEQEKQERAQPSDSDKATKVNAKLKRLLQTVKDKINRLATERPELFTNIGEETSERFDHLIATVEHQATQIEMLQSEHNETQEQLQNEIQELQSSVEAYRYQIENERPVRSEPLVAASAPSVVNESNVDEYEQQVRELQQELSQSEGERQLLRERLNYFEAELEKALDDTSFVLKIQSLNSVIDEQSEQLHQLQAEMNRDKESFEAQINDYANQIDNLSQERAQLLDEIRNNASSSSVQSNDNDKLVKVNTKLKRVLQTFKEKINRLVSDRPELFANTGEETSERFDRLISTVEEQANQINILQNEIEALREYRQEQIQEMPLAQSSNDWDDQQSPVQLETIKTKLQQITTDYPEYFSNTTDNLLDNLDQFVVIIKNLQNSEKQQTNLQSSFIEDDSPKPLETSSTTNVSTPSEQRISRRVFEQEMLAWSKESEQLKQFVKQIQIENKKLKDIISKLEHIIRDYMHENERLKQENQHLSLLSYSINNDDSTTSDTDICYLTLKWLTYEVAQRTSDNSEQSILITDDNEPYLRQRLLDTERQLKSVRIQNQKLRKQLETYAIQFKHIQQENNLKNHELSTLKTENERLHASETQYRLEVDRLKVDLQCDQVRFQQLERELTDFKLERTNLDDSQSSDNLQELLVLKERELKALKDKLEYTIQTHQLELQEAIKSNQFSLDNVQRFEQLDQQHQQKRKDLEQRLGQICKIVRPLIDHQDLFKEESVIDIDELQQLITDTEAEQRVINSLGPIRDCLGLLENQMKELQQNLIENHVRRSKKSKSPIDLDDQWLTSTDFLSDDIRLCLDDLLDEVTVRTTGQ